MEKQTNTNYPFANNSKCPHCGGHPTIPKGSVFIAKYQTMEDEEWMANNTGYSWTEDRLCKNCHDYFSITNGC